MFPGVVLTQHIKLYPKFKGEVLWPEIFLLCGLFPAAVALWCFVDKLSDWQCCLHWLSSCPIRLPLWKSSMLLDMEDIIICFFFLLLPPSLPSLLPSFTYPFIHPCLPHSSTSAFFCVCVLTRHAIPFNKNREVQQSCQKLIWISKNQSESFRSPNSQSSVTCLRRYR